MRNLAFLLICVCELCVAQNENELIFTLSEYTTSEMYAISEPHKGSIIYNTTDNLIYNFNGTTWVSNSPVNQSNSLSIVRGNVNQNATIAQGTGFSIAKNGLGKYTITFNPPFVDLPSITFTSGDLSAAGGYEDNVVNITSLSNQSCKIMIMDSGAAEGTFEDSWFSFIAVGSF